MIPFNKPFKTGRELDYIAEAHSFGHISGDGEFTKRCSKWLEDEIGTYKALLTHSCTAALEMAAILANISEGDEVIMPSYTFVSTANAFVLRGAVPVFVDIRPDTLNIDESLIEAAVTSRTRAIVPVHYAGVACEMDVIMDIAERHNLIVIEDAAQAILSKYKGKHLGTIGHFGCLSFHETKNIISGEGGALLINDDTYGFRAEVVREKGTNRVQFFRGQVDKYTWCDVGSSFLPSDMIAAFLWAQINQADVITKHRQSIWNKYHTAFECLESSGWAIRPVIPNSCDHNAHMYYLLLPNLKVRDDFIQKLKLENINSVFHYIPLHSSPGGLKYGRYINDLLITDEYAQRLVRLPLWIGMNDDVDKVIDVVLKTITQFNRKE